MRLFLKISVKVNTFYFSGAKYLNDWLSFTNLGNEDIYNVRLDIFLDWVFLETLLLGLMGGLAS